MALTPLEDKLKTSLAVTLLSLTEVADAHIKMGNTAAIKVANSIMDVVDKHMLILDEANEKEKESL